METLRVTGQDRGLSQVLERWRPARAVHDPGKIVADLAVSLALGGDCLAGIAALRSSPELFGLVASFGFAARLVKGGRRLRLRLPNRWHWADLIATACTRLQALQRPDQPTRARGTPPTRHDSRATWLTHR